MDLKMITTATIDSQTIERIVREAIERETGRKISELKFKIGSRYVGFGPGESKVEYFDGVSITFTKEKQNA